ncbi:MAG: hypothetical protein Q9M50_09580 [Methylococcales bacterium]|nr:hypothetical protein [Methylococcales bacterium]
MKKTKHSSFILTLGTTLVSGLAATSVYAETSNPFVMTELTEGYMQLAAADTNTDDKDTSKMKAGSCGEGKCGGEMMKGSEEKTTEGNCAGNKPMPKSKGDNAKSGSDQK